MDILIHTLSGATTAAFIATFSDSKTKVKLLMVLLGAFAGALPDIDAISLWSKFDGTFGKWLHLSHSGNQIYFGKFWYSHHGFFHSVFAAALFSIIFMWIHNSCFSKEKWRDYFKRKQTKLLFAVFFFSYISHLLGDLPTPGAAWGGIRLFFPFEIYIGGYGTTWWWNNYDVFLALLVTSGLLLLFILAEDKFLKKDLIKLASGIYIFGVLLCCYFVTHHSISFSYSGNTSRYEYYERTSKIDQWNRLGKRVASYISKIDKHLPFYF
jgi:inner membrane protein